MIARADARERKGCEAEEHRGLARDPGPRCVAVVPRLHRAADPQAFREPWGGPDGVGRGLSAIAEEALGDVFALRLHAALRGAGGIAPGSVLGEALGTLPGMLLDLFG